MSDTQRSEINGLDEHRYVATRNGGEITIFDELHPEAWISANAYLPLEEVR